MRRVRKGTEEFIFAFLNSTSILYVLIRIGTQEGTETRNTYNTLFDFPTLQGETSWFSSVHCYTIYVPSVYPDKN